MGCPFCEALSRKELVEKNQKREDYNMGWECYMCIRML